MRWLNVAGVKWLPMNYTPPRKTDNPIILYIISDNHLGVITEYENLNEFTQMVNNDKPDAVIHMGDAIQGTVTNSYPNDTDRESALEQLSDWLPSWNNIDSNISKEIVLGNRDVASNYPLFDEDWVEALGYENRHVIGGSKMQTSFVVDNGSVRTLFIIISMYSEGYNASITADWVLDEVKGFDGDNIIINSHAISPYSRIRDLLMNNYISIPVLFLHGHNHSTDTLTKDTWGNDKAKFNFPNYCMPNLFSEGIAVAIEIHKGGFLNMKEGSHELGGFHKFIRLDTNTFSSGEPIYHYQVRV